MNAIDQKPLTNVIFDSIFHTIKQVKIIPTTKYFIFGINFFIKSSSHVYLVSKSYNNVRSSWSGEGATANLVNQYELFSKWYDMSHLKRHFSQKAPIKIDNNKN